MISLLVLGAAAVGLGAVSAARPATSFAQLGFRLCAATLLGLGLSSAAWSAGLLSFGSSGGASDLLLAALGIATLLATRARGLTLQSERREPAPIELRVFPALAALFVAALFLEHSVRYPDGGWDATAIWNVRARALARAPGRLDLVFAPELPHGDYPLLVPGLIAHAWRALGETTPVAAVLLHGLFAALAVATPAFAVAHRRGEAMGLMAALLLLGTPCLLTFSWSQVADVPLAAFIVLAAALVNERSFILAGLAAGLGAWTKNEGALALAALAIATFSIAGPRQVAKLVLGSLPPLLLLASFKLKFAPVNDLAKATSAAGLRSRFLEWPRYWTVARAIFSRPFRFEDWGLSLPAAVLGALAPLRRGSALPEAKVPAVTCALLAAFFAAVYVATPRPLDWHLATSLDRLLFQLWPSALYALLLALPLPAVKKINASQRSAVE